MEINIVNLEKLARGLMTVPAHQFEMETFQDVFDHDLFEQHNPNIAEDIRADYGEYVNFAGVDVDGWLTPEFKIQHNCGTSGCALGWAPALVEPGQEGEDWEIYCERVFGVKNTHGIYGLWDYMFSGDWKGKQNTPEATAGRIMYVVKNGDAPRDWDFDDGVILPEFGSEEV